MTYIFWKVSVTQHCKLNRSILFNEKDRFSFRCVFVECCHTILPNGIIFFNLQQFLPKMLLFLSWDKEFSFHVFLLVWTLLWLMSRKPSSSCRHWFLHCIAFPPITHHHRTQAPCPFLRIGVHYHSRGHWAVHPLFLTLQRVQPSFNLHIAWSFYGKPPHTVTQFSECASVFQQSLTWMPRHTLGSCGAYYTPHQTQSP